MGFRLILAGLIFFFNPCINIVDFLPDGIGCILIAAGLSRLADVGDRGCHRWFPGAHLSHLLAGLPERDRRRDDRHGRGRGVQQRAAVVPHDGAGDWRGQRNGCLLAVVA